MILSNKKVFHTQKSTLFCFFLIQKNEKKKKKKMSTEQQQQPASSPPANRLYVGNIPWSTTVEELQALFADATSVEIPTVRVFVVVFCRCVARFFFIPRVVSLFWRTQSALCRKERRHDGDQNRDCADSFDDKKNDDDGFAHPIVSPKEARDATSPDHPLSLSRRETTT